MGDQHEWAYTQGPSVIVLALCLIGLADLILLYRYLYMTMLIRRWEEVVVRYVLASGAHPSKGDQYAEVWPMRLILGHVWEWDLSRFIVDQEGVREVLTYLEATSQESA